MKEDLYGYGVKASIEVLEMELAGSKKCPKGYGLVNAQFHCDKQRCSPAARLFWTV